MALVNKMKIMVSIRDWRFFGKNGYNGYHQNAKRRRRSFVLNRFGECLKVVLIWWLWAFEVTTLSDIIELVSLGSKEQYKYFYI